MTALLRLIAIILSLRLEVYYAYNETGARFLQDGQEYVKIVVGWNPNKDEDANVVAVDRPTTMQDYLAGRTIRHTFQRSSAVAMTIPLSELQDLMDLPGVEFVEEDATVYALATVDDDDIDFEHSETVPWGVKAVQGDQDDEIPDRDVSLDCFKICMVDSGVLITHEDLPFKLVDSNVMGDSFGVTDKWYASTDNHGVHITGIALATAHNALGVRGIVNNASTYCLLVARVFGDVRTTSTSYIDEAVEWCVDNGAKVVNLSLGTSYRSRNSEQIMRTIEDEEDVLIVAAAGNSGNTATMHSLIYPASFSGVISVGSVNDDLTVSAFSQRNDQVDLCAPGYEILSLSAQPDVVLEDEFGEQIESRLIENSARPAEPITAPIHDCHRGIRPCRGATGKICVIGRGENSYAEKAQNCFLGGGIAMVLYDDEPGSVVGSIGDDPPNLPALIVSTDESERLLGASFLTISIGKSSYAVMSGTSMAAPHVTGVIAKIWAARPSCTKSQVREAILSTALDLGDEGKDQDYGAGIVQAVDAYKYLSTFPPPCGTESKEVVAQSLGRPTSSGRRPSPPPTRIRRGRT